MYVRRASFVLAIALAALLAAPARAAQPAPASGHGNDWSVLLGLEDGAGDTGLQLRGDLEFAMRPLSPVVGFSIVGQLAYSRFSESGGYYDPAFGVDDRWEQSVNLFKFGASARFRFGHHPTFHPYADAGLGLYYTGWSGSQTVYVGYPYYAYQKQSYSDSDTGVYLRLAGGVSFQVNPGFALGVELGFHPYIGDVPDETTTSLMASATFRM